MKANRKILAAAAGLLVLAAVLLGVYFAARPQTSAGQKAYTLEITHGDGSMKSLSLNARSEYVGEALAEEGLIRGEDGPYGLYVLEVDGERAVFEEDGAYWAFYVDGEYAAQGIDQTPLRDGARYGLAYTK